MWKCTHWIWGVGEADILYLLLFRPTDHDEQELWEEKVKWHIRKSLLKGWRSTAKVCLR